jgi:hypothetical protein
MALRKTCHKREGLKAVWTLCRPEKVQLDMRCSLSINIYPWVTVRAGGTLLACGNG